MTFKRAALVTTLFALLILGNSQASATTYDLMLNSPTGQLDGTFAVSGSVPGKGPSLLQINSLSLTVGGTAYSFTAQSSPFATFNNGLLTSIEYLGSAAGFKLDLGTFGLGYVFADALNPGLSSVGTVSAVAATATPLPPGLPLFMTGLAALVFLGWRSKRGIEGGTKYAA